MTGSGQGWFGNHRSLKEQMQGLAPALAETKGKRVLDAGSAEGLIALEFVKAGAAQVDAFDNNLTYVAAAEHNARRRARNVMRARWADLNVELPKAYTGRYDIVLALAVLHKAADVPSATLLLAGACSALMVIRLPLGSTGLLRAKFGESTCDLHELMPPLGFRLERDEEGPRKERVQYWRRRDEDGGGRWIGPNHPGNHDRT